MSIYDDNLDDNIDSTTTYNCATNGLATSMMAGCLQFSQSPAAQHHYPPPPPPPRSSSSSPTRDNNIRYNHHNHNHNHNHNHIHHHHHRIVVEPKQEETDAMLAQTLNQLSLEERNQVLHDLHGVAELTEETPTFLSQVLNEFNKELSLIPTHGKQALILAESMSSSFVHDSAFQLGFLRAELYRAKPAAQRMVKYFERKLLLFGQDKLTCPMIRLSDLHPEDLDYFKTGFFHLFPDRDQTGRAILYTKAALVDAVPMDVRYRLMWYLYNVVAQEDESQRKGVIYVCDAIGLKRFLYSYTGRLPQAAQLLQCLPIRLSALHFCYNDPEIHPIIKLAVFALDRNNQCRLRFHYGSRIECHYALMTFGISKKNFPAEDTQFTALLTTNVEEFITQRMAMEESSSSSSSLSLSSSSSSLSPSSSSLSLVATQINAPSKPGEQHATLFGMVVVPTEMDILMGRGKAKLQLYNPGNIRYQKLLRDDAYECAPVKKVVIEHVLLAIKSYHGRFLLALRKDNMVGWIEIDDSHARKKIGHAFRNLRSSPGNK